MWGSKGRPAHPNTTWRRQNPSFALGRRLQTHRGAIETPPDDCGLWTCPQGIADLSPRDCGLPAKNPRETIKNPCFSLFFTSKAPRVAIETPSFVPVLRAKKHRFRAVFARKNIICARNTLVRALNTPFARAWGAFGARKNIAAPSNHPLPATNPDNLDTPDTPGANCGPPLDPRHPASRPVLGPRAGGARKLAILGQPICNNPDSDVKLFSRLYGIMLTTGKNAL